MEFDFSEKELGKKYALAGSLLQTDRLKETQGQIFSDCSIHFDSRVTFVNVEVKLVICQCCFCQQRVDYSCGSEQDQQADFLPGLMNPISHS